MPGSSLAQLGAVAMGLVGLVSVVKARRERREGREDPVADKRLAERLEMERRMASYQAARDDGRDKGR
ncbi:MAG: hypothetical protein ACRC14_17885 [Paracoccaceae bacterium]